MEFVLIMRLLCLFSWVKTLLTIGPWKFWKTIEKPLMSMVNLRTNIARDTTGSGYWVQNLNNLFFSWNHLKLISVRKWFKSETQYPSFVVPLAMFQLVFNFFFFSIKSKGAPEKKHYHPIVLKKWPLSKSSKSTFFRYTNFENTLLNFADPGQFQVHRGKNEMKKVFTNNNEKVSYYKMSICCQNHRYLLLPIITYWWDRFIWEKNQ